MTVLHDQVEHGDVSLIEFSRNTQSWSTLYCFVVKSKLIAKSFARLGLEHQHLRIFIPMPIHHESYIMNVTVFCN